MVVPHRYSIRRHCGLSVTPVPPGDLPASHTEQAEVVITAAGGALLWPRRLGFSPEFRNRRDRPCVPETGWTPSRCL